MAVSTRDIQIKNFLRKYLLVFSMCPDSGILAVEIPAPPLQIYSD